MSTQNIQVPLASNTLYVTGTVNGVSTVWTREEDNIWTTSADKSDDGTYRVVLSIVSASGKTTTDSATLYYGLVLITDRTLSDVLNKTEKGFYNAADLNRVGAAMVYIRDRLNNAGYNIKIEPETLWTQSDIPTKSDMTLYLSYLGTLKNAFALPSFTPEAPSTMEKLAYQGANNIEKILEIIDQLLTNSLESVWYSGELYSGEVI